MKEGLWNLVVLFGSSMLVVGFLTPIMKTLAVKYQVFDNPSELHKTHSVPVPYLGGLGISIGVCLISMLSLLLSRSSVSDYLLAASILLPGMILSFIGLIDDVLRLRPWPRFVAQNLIGLVCAMILIKTRTIGKPTGYILIDVALTLIWIVGLSNAVNFFDNIDGGASGAVAISSFAVVILATQSNQFLIAGQASVLGGATVGFLFWNKPPARIYMGDAGSLFLGILIASLTIRLEPSTINRLASYLTPLLVMAIPILDTSVAVISRIRRGLSPFQGGRDHLSHRLMRIGMDKKKSIICLWLLTIFFCTLALILSISPFRYEGLISALSVCMWLTLLFLFLTTPDSE
jgi:UDP-GlcNAc:undecaprenyl-phosphate GlcNAc-1-phosphate transferase